MDKHAHGSLTFQPSWNFRLKSYCFTVLYNVFIETWWRHYVRQSSVWTSLENTNWTHSDPRAKHQITWYNLCSFAYRSICSVTIKTLPIECKCLIDQQACLPCSGIIKEINQWKMSREKTCGQSSILWLNETETGKFNSKLIQRCQI